MFASWRMPRVATVLVAMLLTLTSPARSQVIDTVGAAITAAQIAAPPGQYVVLEYRTVAGGGKEVVETVTPGYAFGEFQLETRGLPAVWTRSWRSRARFGVLGGNRVAISTKMACADGDKLELSYLATLPEIRSYERSDSTLTLSGSGGPLARYRAP